MLQFSFPIFPCLFVFDSRIAFFVRLSLLIYLSCFSLYTFLIFFFWCRSTAPLVAPPLTFRLQSFPLFRRRTHRGLNHPCCVCSSWYIIWTIRKKRPDVSAMRCMKNIDAPQMSSALAWTGYHAGGETTAKVYPWEPKFLPLAKCILTTSKRCTQNHKNEKFSRHICPSNWGTGVTPAGRISHVERTLLLLIRKRRPSSSSPTCRARLLMSSCRPTHASTWQSMRQYGSLCSSKITIIRDRFISRTKPTTSAASYSPGREYQHSKTDVRIQLQEDGTPPNGWRVKSTPIVVEWGSRTGEISKLISYGELISQRW